MLRGLWVVPRQFAIESSCTERRWAAHSGSVNRIRHLVTEWLHHHGGKTLSRSRKQTIICKRTREKKGAFLWGGAVAALRECSFWHRQRASCAICVLAGSSNYPPITASTTRSSFPAQPVRDKCMQGAGVEQTTRHCTALADCFWNDLRPTFRAVHPCCHQEGGFVVALGADTVRR